MTHRRSALGASARADRVLLVSLDARRDDPSALRRQREPPLRAARCGASGVRQRRTCTNFDKISPTTHAPFCLLTIAT